MCDTPIARITGCCVSSLRILVGDSPYNYSVAIRVNRVMLVSLCAETIKPVSEGTVEGNVSVYQVNPVSRITGEGRGRSFEGRGGLVLIKSERGGRGGGGGCGRVGNLLCVEAIKSS